MSDWHWGPDPAFGNLTKHKGLRETCSGPDCGPDDQESEIFITLDGLDDLLTPLEDVESEDLTLVESWANNTLLDISLLRYRSGGKS